MTQRKEGRMEGSKFILKSLLSPRHQLPYFACSSYCCCSLDGRGGRQELWLLYKMRKREWTLRNEAEKQNLKRNGNSASCDEPVTMACACMRSTLVEGCHERWQKLSRCESIHGSHCVSSFHLKNAVARRVTPAMEDDSSVGGLKGKWKSFAALANGGGEDCNKCIKVQVVGRNELVVVVVDLQILRWTLLQNWLEQEKEGKLPRRRIQASENVDTAVVAAKYAM